MITIGFSTRKIDDAFIDHIKKTCGPKNIEVIPIENNGEYSLSEAHNKVIQKSSYDTVILCHDDIYFDKKGWGNKILKHFNKNEEFGILGVAGSTELPSSAKWWENPNKMKGIVNHEHNGKKWESKYSNSLGNKIEEVVLVDGLFIAINKKRIVSNFDTTISGFHFYDVAFCVNNFISNKTKIGVIYDVRITHKSIGQTNEQWENNRLKFSENNSSILPLKIKLSFESKLNVLISCLFFKDFTGSEMYVFELAKNLLKQNCNVSVVSNIGGPLTDMAMRAGIKCYPISEPPGFKLGDGKWVLNTPQGPHTSVANQLYKISNVKFDIIHTQHTPISKHVCDLYPEIPKITTIHSEVIDLENPHKHSSIKKYITIRPEISKKLIEIDNIESDLIELIYNPIDESRFNTDKVKNEDFILFVGTIDYLRKNTLLDVISYSKSINKKVLIIGENKSDYLSHLMSQDHVEYIGPQKNVERYVKNCFETAGILLGRTTIEGWMCGKNGWIYDIDNEGKILSKTLSNPPSDIYKFYSSHVSEQIKKQYLEILNT